jgi:hypothetical protein
MEMKLEAQGVMQVQGPQEVLHPEEIMEAIVALIIVLIMDLQVVEIQT